MASLPLVIPCSDELRRLFRCENPIEIRTVDTNRKYGYDELTVTVSLEITCPFWKLAGKGEQ